MEWTFEWFNLQYEELWKVRKMVRHEEGEWYIPEKIQTGGGGGEDMKFLGVSKK